MSSADYLDELFGKTAEACRRWLLAYTEAKPAPSRAGDREHERLVEAHNELEELVAAIADVFEP
jgi:hypothetical protein